MSGMHKIKSRTKWQRPEQPHLSHQKGEPGWHLRACLLWNPSGESAAHMPPLPSGLDEGEAQSSLPLATSGRRAAQPLSEGRTLTHSLPPLGSHTELQVN